MESETCDLTQMGPVFQRIHLDDMGSVSKCPGAERQVDEVDS